jgi:predicted MFS family arabinose efflux permease
MQSRDGLALTSDPAKVEANRYLVVAMLAGVYTLSFLDRQLLSILAEPVKADLGLSDTQLGLLTGFMFALFYTVFGVPVAWLADRSSRVRIVAAACALWSLFSAGCGLAQNFVQLALARMGVGIGEAGGSPPSYSIIADYFPPEQRGGALALYSLGIPLGTTAGAALGAWIASSYGWRTAFVAIGLFGIVFALLVLLTVREPQRGRLDGAAAPQLGLGESLKLFAADRVLRGAAIAGGLSAFVGYAMLSWTPALLMRVKGMSLADLGVYYGVASGVALALGMLLGGHLVDRFGTRDRRMYALVPAVAFVVALPFYVGAVEAGSWPLALLLITVPLALYAMYLAPVLAIVQNAVPAARRSTASAILLLIINLIGLGGGPLFIGSVSDAAAGYGWTDPLQLAMFALAPLFLLTTLAHLRVARALHLDATTREGKLS